MAEKEIKVRLIEKTPMHRGGNDPNGEIIWFGEGEIFKVIKLKYMNHDPHNKWYKLKSQWFTVPLKGFHNPRGFEIIQEGEVE